MLHYNQQFNKKTTMNLKKVDIRKDKSSAIEKHLRYSAIDLFYKPVVTISKQKGNEFDVY